MTSSRTLAWMASVADAMTRGWGACKPPGDEDGVHANPPETCERAGAVALCNAVCVSVRECVSVGTSRSGSPGSWQPAQSATSGLRCLGPRALHEAKGNRRPPLPGSGSGLSYMRSKVLPQAINYYKK
jgi:hypothetical protein